MSLQRNTIQRGLVLDAVRAINTHPTADEIYGFIEKNHPNISRATVYRNLNLLTQQGNVRRVSHLNAADRFDFQLKPHYHLYCTCCTGVFDVDLPYNEHLLNSVPNPQKFIFESYEISFRGVCPACQLAKH